MSTLYYEGESPPAPGTEVRLDGEEATHVRALRLRTGAHVEITDGRGGRWAARLTDIDRRSAVVAVESALPASPPRPLTLLAPVGHRDRSLWLVEKAVELGVETIRFVEFARSRSVADAGRSAGFLEKAGRRAIAALKQSGGSTLPALAAPESLDDVLDGARGRSGFRWIADRDGAPVARAAEEVGAGPLELLVGPEGGIEPREREACVEAGFVPVSLGPRTLRFETAALAGLAVIAAALDARSWTKGGEG